MKKQFMKWKRQFAAVIAMIMILSSALPAAAGFAEESNIPITEAEQQLEEGEDTLETPDEDTDDPAAEGEDSLEITDGDTEGPALEGKNAGPEGVENPEAEEAGPEEQPAADITNNDTMDNNTAGTAVRIPIFQTTDVHGHTIDISSGNPDTYQYRMPYIANIVEEARDNESNDAVILLDGGDIFQGHPLSNEYQGQPMSAIYQTMGYDAAALGNHEYDWGIGTIVDQDKTLRDWEYEANGTTYKGTNTVPVLACNIYHNDTKTRVAYTEDYKILDKGGKKIAVIGYVSDYALDIMTSKFSEHYYIDPSVSIPNEIAKRLKEVERVDAVIILSHADPRSLAGQLDSDYVDLVFGGHTHAGLSGTAANGIPYLQGNSKAQGYAYAELVFDADGSLKINDAKYVDILGSSSSEQRKKLYNTVENVSEYFDQAVYDISKDALTDVLETLGEKLGTIDVELTKTMIPGTRSSTAGTWSADLIRRATETDVAVNNDGGIRTEFKFADGENSRVITALDLLNMFPFGNDLPAFHVTGQELWDIVTYTIENEGLYLSGLTVSYYLTTDNEGNKAWVVSKVIMDNGDDLSKNLDKEYTISTNEYVATMAGSPFLTISQPERYNIVPVVDSEEFLDVLREERDGGDGTLAIDTAPKATSRDSVIVNLMSTTDIHGKVWSTNILSGSAESRNLLKAASVVKTERNDYKENMLLVDNGDLYQGTPISSYNILNGGKNNPLAVALRYIGYDAAVLGNHEFNYSLDTMNSIYEFLNSAADENGTPVEVLAANIYYANDDAEAGVRKGDNAYKPYIIKDFTTLNGDTVKVGVIGFENTDVTRWDLPENYRNLSFCHPTGNPAKSMVWEAERYVGQLKKQGCDIIIVSYHSGMGDATSALEFGKTTENQIRRMIAETNGIDLVIAGHDHVEYKSVTVENKDKKAIPVVNGGSRNLTKTLFAVEFADGESNIDIITYDNIELNGTYKNKTITEDTTLAGLVKGSVDAATTYVERKIGTVKAGDWNPSTNHKMEQTDAMDLINRAQIWTAETELSKKENKDVTVHVSATTNITAGSGFQIKPGDMTYKDVYNLYRYDNYLYVVPMTGKDLKAWMEGVAEFYYVDKDGSYKVESNFVTAIYYGVSFTYNLARDKGQRVEGLKLSDGTPITDTMELNVAVNNYVISQAPFTNTGKSAKDAIWFSEEEMGGLDSLITEMVAAYVAYETDANGGISPAKSLWALDCQEAITGINLNRTTAALKVNEKLQLIPTVTPPTATNPAVSWKTDNDTVATVTADGLVTAKANGTAIITATAKDGSGVSAACTVTVTTDVTKVTLSQKSLTIAKGKNAILRAEVTPATASNQIITWSSSNGKVAKVDRLTGNVTGVAKGTATITATSTNNKTDICKVTIAEVKLNVTSAKLQEGKKTTNIKIASKYPSNDTVKSWKSSNTSVASVTSKGEISGRKAGTTTITVTMKSGAAATCKLTVQKGAVRTTRLTMSSSRLTLLKGRTATLTANRTPVTATDKITWTTSNKKVAAVTSKGKVTAKSVGTATITAKSANNKTTKCVVTVPGVTLKSTKGTVKIGKTLTISIKSKTPKNDAIASCKSNKINIATVTSKGKITGKKAGKAKITVTMKSGATAIYNVTVTK